uniref:DOMON domain-containing protein n=1 Tax=Panagrellus redivivus TaxID=6233 RepID=A0A7E4VC55_PANRE
MKLCSRLIALALLAATGALAQMVVMDREGCGETKGCLFKPAGCDPMRDCTIGIIFYVSGLNLLSIQVVATMLLPPPPLQYIAIGFSQDSSMGDDMITECVISPVADEFSMEPEVFVSYNIGKSNDRTYLNETEQNILIRDVKGEAVNGRISCQWAQQIIPQIPSHGGRLWNLNRKYYVLGATGSAQPDEVNAHDTSMGSHFYPMVSARPINPSVIGEKIYDLPPPYVAPPKPTTPVPPPTSPKPKPSKKNSANGSSSGLALPLFISIFLYCFKLIL